MRPANGIWHGREVCAGELTKKMFRQVVRTVWLPWSSRFLF
jgi:hypothetical protein